MERHDFQQKTSNMKQDMMSVIEVIKNLKQRGYIENIYARYDHFACCDGLVQLVPPNFSVDDLIRVGNSTDPDDQSIIYAITGYVDNEVHKGIYVESYGIYHETMSPAMAEHIKLSRQQQLKEYQEQNHEQLL